LYSSDVTGMTTDGDEMVGACTMHGGIEKLTQNLVGKPQGDQSLGRSRHRWENNIKRHLKETACEKVHWMNLAQGREHCQVPVNIEINIWAP
jgi:hypothetical protein